MNGSTFYFWIAWTSTNQLKFQPQFSCKVSDWSFLRCESPRILQPSDVETPNNHFMYGTGTSLFHVRNCGHPIQAMWDFHCVVAIWVCLKMGCIPQMANLIGTVVIIQRTGTRTLYLDSHLHRPIILPHNARAQDFFAWAISRGQSPFESYVPKEGIRLGLAHCDVTEMKYNERMSSATGLN